MKFVDEFRNSDLARGLIDRVWHESHRRVRLMEFCGGHTFAIMKAGLRQLLPPSIDMVSGPGCPVCVTDVADLDKAIAMAKVPGVILATFGDMMRVPGSRSSLQEAKAEGADVRMVYSTMDALDLARANPDRPVVFLGVGFETTAPTVAASVLKAHQEGMPNYYVLLLHKLCPPALRALLDAGEADLSGMICPGHVSAITGSLYWEFLARDYGIPCVVAGFEALDILQAVHMLVEQVEKGEARVETAYTRSVRPEGNKHALEAMDRVFEPVTAAWRGLGAVPESGLKLRDEFSRFDAGAAFYCDPGPTKVRKGCICGEILRGVKVPTDCRLYGRACTPASPVGPCMVSSEGSCAAYYQYGGGDG